MKACLADLGTGKAIAYAGTTNLGIAQELPLQNADFSTVVRCTLLKISTLSSAIGIGHVAVLFACCLLLPHLDSAHQK